jgi:hypothetical protein
MLGASIVEKAVDVVIRNLCEWRISAWCLRFGENREKDSVKLSGGLSHPQTHQSKAGFSIENHDKDDAIAN